ncbi:GGDEF domain-containing protein [Cohnella laeviribosi]|uniref:GGDEF domain-containing protein n=1 Tax=Cohnella laeviribosi TaxID=380174 RepID=UPI00037622F4|nr:GGDEF domain-containing protein [Cohnella laeviribosi]
MQRGFKTKLMLIMGIFSIALTLSVSLVNQHRWKDNLITNYMREVSLVEDIIVNAVSDADKAFQMLDSDIEKKMKEYSDRLLEKYRENPNVASWDYQALKNEFGGMDVYIIDDTQTILYSSFAKDIGLNFREKDGTLGPFARILRDRLNGNQFVADGLDQETNTGKLKKFSYVPTPDHKYLIELGLYLEDNPIFKSFNFLEVINKLKEKYCYIHDITVFTTSGKAIGKPGEDGKSLLVADENRPFFEKAVREKTIQEVKRTLNGDPITYRYVPYTIQFETDVAKHTDHRIIEIVYNEKELNNQLKQNNQIFLLQLLATIACALMVSYIITRLVARPMYLASHDLLTGLSNRAVFENSLTSSIEKNKKKGRKTGLLHIDLDNFKKINDTLGHEAGDYFLKEVGGRIRSVVHDPDDITARLGGDEFVVILNNITDENTASEVALQLIQELQRPIEIKGTDVIKDFNITASIGIALAPDHAQDADELYNCADQALYHAKRTGKNTFSVYSENIPG